MNCWGEQFRVTIFGESHGAGIGVVIDGIPAGVPLDLEEIRREMRRRAPGQNALSTPRNEKDEVKFLSGFFAGKTTGTPLAGLIENTNTISKDYTPELLRPGHADFTGFMKYGECHDYRGGGHFSGRLTAPIVFAGAIAKQILDQEGIKIGAHILRVGSIVDQAFDPVTGSPELFDTIRNRTFPTVDAEAGDAMQAYIVEKKNELDSVGGIIECSVTGLPVGLGNPFFESVESKLSSMMFSIPAVKGIEFGDGFQFAEMPGSMANDAFCMQHGTVKTKTNHNGGINGGITNGMPLLFKVVMKPTPSIAKPQQTVNLKTMENTEVSIRGRHDPCIAHRAVPVVEAGCAIALLDMLKTK
ncbi:MAG: chorismate synthase [Clostridia bacterium]|nr:chorismate synthase [Clostridia bacterium]